MSDPVDNSPPSPPKPHLHNSLDLGSDILLWRKKHLSVLLLLAATATWTIMELYQYNFITVLSYVVMAIVVCLFLWGNIHRLLKKESPDLTGLEISEQTVVENAILLRQWMEKGIRLMFHVSSEREWSVFAGVVAVLYVLSLVGSCIDFLTFCYIGVVGLMTVPVIYINNKQRIRDFGEKLRMRLLSLHSTIEDKMHKIKDKMEAKKKEIKEKKTE